jgi:phage repressor protein C with HTH and peptisase S24 domain
MTNDQEIAERLKFARQAAGFDSASDAADALGIPYPTVASHENGSRGIGRVLDRYSQAYGVSLDWLLNGEGESPTHRPRQSADVREMIRSAVASNLTTYKELSEAIGKNHAYVQQFVLRGVPRDMKERDARIIAELIGSIPATTESAPSRSRGFVPRIVPGRELVGEKNFPIYAAAMGGDGHQIVTFEAIDYVKRPAILENVKDAYGMYIVGESMIPAFVPGDMALVHPHLPPARDKNVILYHVSPFGTSDAEAIVKRLQWFSERDWHLLQYNPTLEFVETRADWPYCHRIVGKYEAR